MSEKIKNIPIGSISIIAILLFLILLINNVQITLGRYMSSVDGKAVFLFNAKQNPELDYGEWEEVDGRPTLSVNINKNSNIAKDGAIRIRLYIPQTEDLVGVRISVNDEEYTSKISEISSGTAVHKLYGDGNICCFYGDFEQEVRFDFSDSSNGSLIAILTLIADASIDTTGIKIMAEPINTKGNGGN